MRDKPQMIKANIDSGFLKRYVEMIVPAIKRKFNISIGIEGELFTNTGGVEEIIIRFLATDDLAQDIYRYIDGKFPFASIPELVA
ncbi:hypothetical protein PMV44_01665 [Enterococcus casseliflavus]|uniref:hypothetical protein n=1 Tax=Enterococcus casseliflavus TaxID=37734 RepID=UPI002330DAC6|nr:hypothetical protein [Enterococcus casseliflavus]MDB1690554.1 hypothetical protein [Enterococcus casseliflavus]